MKKIIFNGGSVQKGDRIKIPPAIKDTLNILPGEKIIIYFDPDNEEIIIRFDKKRMNSKYA